MEVVPKLTNRRIQLTSAHASSRDLIGWDLRRGALPALRGLVRARLYAKVRLPIAIGRGVRVLGGHHLHLGRGVILGEYTRLSCHSQRGVVFEDNVTIREFGWLQCSSSLVDPLGVGIKIGRGTYIGPRSYLGVSGYVTIGANCDIGGSFTLLAENHLVSDTAQSLRGSGTSALGIHIGDDCWIGNNVTILDGVTVGSGAVVGAGSVVTKDVVPNSVVVGVPARLLRMRT